MKLEGFLIDVHSPSEANLEVEIDCSRLDWEDYKTLISELEDILSSIDQEHSVRSWLVKGRSLKARYSRITTDNRTRKLRFCPYPSMYPNTLTSGRGQIYSLIAQYCVVLETIGTRKVYLLPKGVAPQFIASIERLNEVLLVPLRENINLFRSSPNWLKITSLMTKYDLDFFKLIQVPSFGRFRIDVIPVDFKYNINQDDFYLGKLRDKEITDLDLLRKEIDRKYREYTYNAVKDIMEKLSVMAEEFDTKRYHLEFFKKRMDQLTSLCNSLGLSELVIGFLDPIKRISQLSKNKRFDELERTFHNRSLVEVVKQCVASYHP